MENVSIVGGKGIKFINIEKIEKPKKVWMKQIIMSSVPSLMKKWYNKKRKYTLLMMSELKCCMQTICLAIKKHHAVND